MALKQGIAHAVPPYPKEQNERELRLYHQRLYEALRSPRLMDEFLPVRNGEGFIGKAGQRFAEVRGILVVAGDLGFEETTCPTCGQIFEPGEELMLRVISTGHAGIRTIPIHKGC